MASEETDIKLFTRLGQLPDDVIALIISYVPKCQLQPLLGFSPTKKAVVKSYLANVKITECQDLIISGTCNQSEHRDCQDKPAAVSLKNLRLLVKQWNLYPKTLYFSSFKELGAMLDVYPEVVINAEGINGVFDKEGSGNRVQNIKQLTRYDLKYDRLELKDFGDTFLVAKSSLPGNVKTLILNNTRLETLSFTGLKKLKAEIPGASGATKEITFPIGLRLLILTVLGERHLNIPSNLVRLHLHVGRTKLSLSSGIMVNLKDLLISWNKLRSFAETGIIAPNLESLNIVDCYYLMDYTTLKLSWKLQSFTIINSPYPIGLFDETSFPHLVDFSYKEVNAKNYHKVWSVSFNRIHESFNLQLFFPPNLKNLTLYGGEFAKSIGFVFMLPPLLEKLHIHNFRLKFPITKFPQHLEEIILKVPAVYILNELRIPPQAKTVVIEAKKIVFRCMDFFYDLPEGLEKLTLHAINQGKILPFPRRIKWPSSMKSLTLKRFNIDYKRFRKLNLQESNLELIDIYKGRIWELSADALPVSVVQLKLIRMGIETLPESFEKFENLKCLDLSRNPLKRIRSVRLPLPSFKQLIVNRCDLHLISPFLTSMLEKENRKAEFAIMATNNWYLNTYDVLKMMKKLKHFTIYLSTFNEKFAKLHKHSRRIAYEIKHTAENSEETEFSGAGEYADEELYCEYDDFDDFDDDDDDDDNKGAMIRRQLNDCWKVNDSGDEITHLDDPDNLYGMDDKKEGDDDEDDDYDGDYEDEVME